MDREDLVGLIAGATNGGGRWAELGSGDGNFTLALATLIEDRGSIVSVDRDRRALATQRERFQRSLPGFDVEFRVADFTSDLGLTGLDGVLMANSLHFLSDQSDVLSLVRAYLRPSGRLLIVEYDSDRGNPWVPHPFSFSSWRVRAEAAGFHRTRVVARYAGRFMGGMYSAVSECD